MNIDTPIHSLLWTCLRWKGQMGCSSPCCGSPALFSSPPQRRWRSGHRDSGVVLPQSTWRTERSCRWSKSTQGGSSGGCRSSRPPPPGAAPWSGSWSSPSPGASGGAWSTTTPRTSGRSLRQVMGCLCSSHRGRWIWPPGQTGPPSQPSWSDNPRWCCTAWSSSAVSPYHWTPRGTQGTGVTLYCWRPRCQNSCWCSPDSSCGHRGGPLDPGRAGGRWGSSAPVPKSLLVLMKTWRLDVLLLLSVF